MTIAQGNLRSMFHASLLEQAKQGRALDAISDGWEMLDFQTNYRMTDHEISVWNQVNDHILEKPATTSQAAPGSFASAVISLRGTIAGVDPNFAHWLGSAKMAVTLKEMRDLARLARGGRVARKLLNDYQGRPILVTGLERHAALRWPLSDLAKAALSEDETAICLVAFAPTRSDTLLASVKTTFSLSPSEAKLAISLLQHDSLDEAATAIGITETTANGYRKSLFRKMAVKRRSEMVQVILEIGYRERGQDPILISNELAGMFDLSTDQMNILGLLAEGLTIPYVAKKLTMNIHTARDHVRIMFEQVGVNKQSELVRVALEYSALATLSQAGEVTANCVSDLLSNTRVIARPEGGLVYLADYGPRDGIPVLLFHAGLGTRRILPSFLRLTAGAGVRVIAIERPGYGGSDIRQEPIYQAAALDAVMVLDKLGLKSVIVASIAGGNIAALAFADLYPLRVRSGLLINPTPPRDFKIKARSPGAALHQMAFSNPTMIRTMAKVMRNQMRTDLLDNFMDQYFATCEADRIAYADPEVRAVNRASVQASVARTAEGFIREEEAFARNWVKPQLSCGPWTIAVGLQDHFCDAATAQNAWGDLPGFEMVKICNAGRFIFASRGEFLVSCLLALAKGKPMPIDSQSDVNAHSSV